MPAPAGQLLLRTMLTNEFLGMPARLDAIERDVADITRRVTALERDVAALRGAGAAVYTLSRSTGCEPSSIA